MESVWAQGKPTMAQEVALEALVLVAGQLSNM
jgi:hypothetical protein